MNWIACAGILKGENKEKSYLLAGKNELSFLVDSWNPFGIQEVKKCVLFSIHLIFVAPDRKTAMKRWSMADLDSSLKKQYTSPTEGRANHEVKTGMHITRRFMQCMSSFVFVLCLRQHANAPYIYWVSSLRASPLLPLQERICLCLFMFVLNFFYLLANFWHTLRGPFSALSKPNVASK